MYKRKDGQDFVMNVNKDIHGWLKQKAEKESERLRVRYSMNNLVQQILADAYEQDRKTANK